MSFKPFNPQQPVRVTKQVLPHWRQAGTTYFVTSRLADSMPQNVLDQWRAKRDTWLHEHQATSLEDLAEEFRLDYQRLFTDRFHELLDAGYGDCVLSKPECAAILTGKLIEGHDTCFELGAWCVMPNHLHALVTPARGSVLGEIVQHWKGGSSFAINRLIGRRGALWLAEPFDHIVRSAEQWRRLSVYVAENPLKAGLRAGYVLGYGNEVGLTLAAMREKVANASAE